MVMSDWGREDLIYITDSDSLLYALLVLLLYYSLIKSELSITKIGQLRFFYQTAPIFVKDSSVFTVRKELDIS